MADTGDELPQRFATHVAAVKLLRLSASVLASEGIPLMPLKGIWLQGRVYEPPEARVLTDVDVIVPRAQYPQALRALRKAGFKTTTQGSEETALKPATGTLPLDLHRELFTRGAFRMPNADLFARGTPAGRLFGAPVVEPDPLDVFAHLVGHFVKSRAEPTDAVHRTDLEQLAQRYGLAPLQVAEHLERCGLARAGRFVMSRLANGPASFCASVRHAFSPDPAGEWLVRVVLALDQPASKLRTLGTLRGFALDRSLPRGTLALLHRLRDTGSPRQRFP